MSKAQPSLFSFFGANATNPKTSKPAKQSPSKRKGLTQDEGNSQKDELLKSKKKSKVLIDSEDEHEEEQEHDGVTNDPTPPDLKKLHDVVVKKSPSVSLSPKPVGVEKEDDKVEEKVVQEKDENVEKGEDEFVGDDESESESEEDEDEDEEEEVEEVRYFCCVRVLFCFRIIFIFCPHSRIINASTAATYTHSHNPHKLTGLQRNRLKKLHFKIQKCKINRNNINLQRRN
jgi:hypothetical protein